MSPPRKDPIQNQDKIALGIPKYLCLPSHISPFSSESKSLINKANDDNTETTDTKRTDKDDTSLTDQYYYIESVKAMEEKNDNSKYKEENLQHQHSDESVINTTKE